VTEAEWDACADPGVMLEALRGKVSDRKLRLFAVACCRRMGPLLTGGGSRAAVETAERYADGLAGDGELDAAWRAARAVACEVAEEGAQSPRAFAARVAFHTAALNAFGRATNPWRLAAHAAGAAAYTAAVGPVPLPAEGFDAGPTDDPAWSAAAAAEAATQAALVRDVFGNPLRRVRLDPAWLRWNGGTVAKLAAAIYDGRRFADLPILADALEEAGCTNADILSHCRGGGEHVRGCWAVDLLTGRQ
jgi:hypothetical protein